MFQGAEYVYVLHPTRIGMLTEGPTLRESAIVSRHAGYLHGLAEPGVVLHFGRTLEGDERTFGIVVFRAESEEAARRIMADDPAVEDGVMRADLHPYRVVYPGRH